MFRRRNRPPDDPAAARKRQRRRVIVGLAAAGVMGAATLTAVGVWLGQTTPVPDIADATGIDRPGTETTTGDSGQPTQRDTGAGVQAAITHLGLLNGPAWYDGDARDRLLRDIADDSVREKLLLAYDEAARQIDDTTGLVTAAEEGAPLVSSWAPLGYDIERTTENYVAVRIWGVTVTGTVGASAPPQSAWATTTVTEHWTEGRWQLAGMHTVRGPIPVADDAFPSDAADMVPAVLDLEEVGHGPLR